MEEAVFFVPWVLTLIYMVLWQQASRQLRGSRRNVDSLLATCKQWEESFKSLDEASNNLHRTIDSLHMTINRYKALTATPVVTDTGLPQDRGVCEWRKT
jgi:hypothetical protein